MARALSVLLVATWTATLPAAAAERSAVLSLRRFELLDRLSGIDESSELNFYLKAVADSLTFANVYLGAGGQRKLFCTNDPLDVPQIRRILRERIEFLSRIGKDSDATKERIGAVTVVIERLRETYPCR